MEEDDDELEITGWRKETPKPPVTCGICQKSLPNENALTLHCNERHGGLREKSAPSTSTGKTSTGSIADFFVKPPQEKRGRPRKVASNRGRHAASSTTPPSHETVQTVPQPPRPKSAPPARRLVWTRDNATDPEFYDGLKSAIAAWNAMTPEQQKGQMPDFCKKRGLKRETFRAYVRKDNPRKLGVRPGRPRLLSMEDEQFVVRSIVMNDRANQGLTVPQTIDVIQELWPDLSRKQAQDVMRQTVQPSHADVLSGLPEVF